jgi:hypothetical protein
MTDMLDREARKDRRRIAEAKREFAVLASARPDTFNLY